MIKICLDANILSSIFKIDDATAKAVQLIGDLEADKNIEIVIPSIVLAEFMCAFDKSLHEDIVKRFQDSFTIVPFEQSAALIFSDIMKKKRPDVEVSKTVMKADYLIIATAIANECTEIFTEDTNFIKFAVGLIESKTLPPLREKQAFLDGIGDD